MMSSQRYAVHSPEYEVDSGLHSLIQLRLHSNGHPLSVEFLDIQPSTCARVMLCSDMTVAGFRKPCRNRIFFLTTPCHCCLIGRSAIDKCLNYGLACSQSGGGSGGLGLSV